MEQPIPTNAAEETQDKTLQYRKTPKEFKDILVNRKKVFHALMKLNAAVNSLEKGHVLRFWITETEFHDFTKKDLRTCEAKFGKEEVELHNYLKVSKKKNNPRSGPESLKATYTPIFAGPALTTFFTKGGKNFGPVHPLAWKKNGTFGQSLMEALPYASQGYLLRNTCTMLFFIYAHAQELQEPENAQFTHFDAVMTEAFARQPAVYYADKNGKMLMQKAIAQKLTLKELTTEEVIRLKRPEFNGDRTPIIKTDDPAKQIYRKSFNNYFFQCLASNNYYSKANLAESGATEVLTALQSKQFEEAMIAEHNIVHAVASEWKELLEPVRKLNRDKRKKEKDAINKAAKAAAK